MKGILWVGIILLGLGPLVLGGYPLRLAGEAVAWAMGATSLAFLYRTTGLVSLGHAAFFGGGAYVAALLTREDPAYYFLALPLALFWGVASAVALGWLGLRSHGIYFLMLTLAFAQLIYVLAKQGFPGITGGDDGLTGIPRPPGLEGQAAYYLAGLGLLLGVLVLYQAFLTSPLGLVLDALRLNERRLEALGWDVRRYKLLAFALSGALAALGGVWLAGQRGFVHPHDLAWTTSGQLLVMAVVGGIRPVYAGTLGAVVLILLEATLSAYTNLWNLFLGIFLMVAALLRLRRSKGAEHVPSGA